MPQHLTGDNDPDTGLPRHPQLVERRFSDEIPGLLQHADLAISRAGAGSFSELAVCSTPPCWCHSHGSRPAPGGQCRLRRIHGAAVIVHQHEPEHGALKAPLKHLLGPRLSGCTAEADPLVSMANGMERLAIRDAEAQLATLLSALST